MKSRRYICVILTLTFLLPLYARIKNVELHRDFWSRQLRDSSLSSSQKIPLIDSLISSYESSPPYVLYKIKTNLLLESQRFNEIIETTNEAIKRYPTDSMIQRMDLLATRALAKVTISDYSGALSDAYYVVENADILKSEESTLRAGLIIVDLLKQQGLYSLALKYNEKIEKKLPTGKIKDNNSVILNHNKAEIFLNLGNPVKSMEILQSEKTSHTPSQELAHLLNLGLTAYNLKDYSLSENYFRKSVEMDLSNFNSNPAVIGLLETLISQDKTSEARKFMQDNNERLKWMQSTIMNKEVKRVRSMLYLKEGKWKEAALEMNNYMNAKDSLMTDIDNGGLVTTLFNLESSSKDKKIAECEKKASTAQTVAWMLGSILAVTAVILVMTIRKNKRNNHADTECDTDAPADVAALSQKIGRLTDIFATIETIVVDPVGHEDEKIKSLRNILQNTMHDRNSRLTFEQCFDDTHQQFYKQLYKICPSLTSSEVKMCAYIRAGMSAKEIADATNRSVRTVQTIIYNTRKKLNITGSTELWLKRL